MLKKKESEMNEKKKVALPVMTKPDSQVVVNGLLDTLSKMENNITTSMTKIIDEKLEGMDDVVLELVRCKTENENLKNKVNELNKENFKLVLSSSASNPRVYIANDYKKENPIKAPMFCMLFRKYIQNGIITEISQIDFERIIKISVESFDELKEKTTKDIYVEIMGRHSNIILTQNNKIIDSIKRIPPSISRVRQLLPNMTYELPPAQDKINPIKGVSIKSFINTLREFDGPISKAIYSKFLGISPTVAKEICYRSNIKFDAKNFTSNWIDIKELFDEENIDK